MCDHLSGRRVAAPLGAAHPGLTQSPRERVHMKTSRLPPSADGFVPAWPCSRRGLPVHSHYCKCRWSLTPPFHHRLRPPPPNPQDLGEVPRRGGGGGSLFLWPCSGRFAPQRRLPRPGDYPTPCPVECGLSSMASTRHRDRPTDLRHGHHTRKGGGRQRRGITDKFENGNNFTG